MSKPSASDGIHKDYVFKLQFKNHIYFFRAESEYTFDRYVNPESAITGSCQVCAVSHKCLMTDCCQMSALTGMCLQWRYVSVVTGGMPSVVVTSVTANECHSLEMTLQCQVKIARGLLKWHVVESFLGLLTDARCLQ